MRARKPLNRPTRPGCWLPWAANVVGLGLERVEVDVAGRFHHQLEAAGDAQAVHRRRPEDVHAGLRDLALKPFAELGRDRVRAERRIAAFVERLEGEEHASRGSS